MSVSANEKAQIAALFSGACPSKSQCPVKDIVANYGDKWSLYTLLLLGQHSNMRFNELRGSISGISQRMLTVTLRSLEEDGLVCRTIYPEVPPHVEYELTDLGESLLHQLLQLAQWAAENQGAILKARTRYKRKQAVKGILKD